MDPVESPTDADLLRAHVAGDAYAFSELVRRHQDRLWSVAVRTLGNPDEAADAVQDALLSAFRHAASFRGDAAVGSWLHRIVVNACIDRQRAAAARPAIQLPEHASETLAEPADAIADRDNALTLEPALAALPPDQRIAVVLVDIEGYSIAEVARICSVAQGTVKSRCARGRRRLAQLIGVPENLPEDGNPVPSSSVKVVPAQPTEDRP